LNAIVFDSFLSYICTIFVTGVNWRQCGSYRTLLRLNDT